MQINIPSFTWSPYGLAVITAVVVGFVVALIYMRKFGVAKQTMIYTSLLTLVCTLVTSVLVVIRITPDGLEMGFSGLGAAVGLVAGIFISGLVIKDKPDDVMASFVASAPLMYGLAKFGCLFAGCCHGKEYTGPMAIVYHGANARSYFPTQLIDMASFIIVFVISSILIIKLKNKLKAIYITFAMLIPVRYALEYLKYYHEGHIIESGQLKVLLAGVIAVGLIFIWQKVLKIKYR